MESVYIKLLELTFWKVYGAFTHFNLRPKEILTPLFNPSPLQI